MRDIEEIIVPSRCTSHRIICLPIDTSAKTFDIPVEDNKAYETLNGEWHFYHEQLLTADDVEQRLAAGENGQIVSIPDSFENQVGMTNTYGTFATYVSIPASLVGESLSIHNPFQYSAYRLFVDNSSLLLAMVLWELTQSPIKLKWHHVLIILKYKKSNFLSLCNYQVLSIYVVALTIQFILGQQMP